MLLKSEAGQLHENEMKLYLKNHLSAALFIIAQICTGRKYPYVKKQKER